MYLIFDQTNFKINIKNLRVVYSYITIAYITRGNWYLSTIGIKSFFFNQKHAGKNYGSNTNELWDIKLTVSWFLTDCEFVRIEVKNVVNLYYSLYWVNIEIWF